MSLAAAGVAVTAPAAGQSATSPWPAEQLSSAKPTELPQVTVTAPKHKMPAQKPQETPAVPAVPNGVVIDGGPPVTQTTAGPVSGYRALTSQSATKTDTPIEQIPQSVAVIPRTVIEDQRPVTQDDLFRNVSGVSAMPPNEFIGYIYKVRGFAADRFVDGLPNYWDGGDNISTVNTERLEVLKGPAGILYQAGLDPGGGIINTISKLPTATRSYETGVMAGGYRLWNPWFDINQPLNSNGTALFRVTGDFTRSRDYIDVIEHRRYSLNPTLKFDNHDGTALTIQGRFSAHEFEAYPGLPGAGTVDRSLFTTRPDLFPGPSNLPKSNTTYDGVTVRLDREFNDVWSMDAATRVGHTTLDEFVQFPASANPALSPTPIAGSTFLYFNSHFPIDSREISSNVNFIAKSTVGAAKNVFLFGIDYDNVADKVSANVDQVSGPGTVDFANPAFPAYTLPTTPAFNANNRYENSGLTAQLQSTLWDRVHLLTGVRLAHVRMHTTDAVAQTDFISDTWKPLPRAGAVVDLIKGISIFGDYSESLRGVPFFNGATAPKPEESRQTEGGLKLALPSGFSATLAYFVITRRNVVNLLPGSVITAVQVGEQRSKGVDADVIWQPIRGLSILASYAHIDAYIVEDQLYPSGNTLDRVPKDSGRLWANYKFQEGTLRDVSIGAGLYASSRQATALDNLYFTPGFITFDAKVAYEKEHWSLALIGKNLTDRRYFQPFPQGLGTVAPGEPLTVYAVATLKY